MFTSLDQMRDFASQVITRTGRAAIDNEMLLQRQVVLMAGLALFSVRQSCRLI